MRIVALIILALPAAFAAETAPAQANPDVAAGIRIFEGWMDEHLAYRGLPGVAVGVVHDQQLVWARGFGYADVDRKTPVKSGTLFRMASHTKMFTAIAIGELLVHPPLENTDARGD